MSRSYPRNSANRFNVFKKIKLRENIYWPYFFSRHGFIRIFQIGLLFINYYRVYLNYHLKHFFETVFAVSMLCNLYFTVILTVLIVFNMFYKTDQIIYKSGTGSLSISSFIMVLCECLIVGCNSSSETATESFYIMLMHSTYALLSVVSVIFEYVFYESHLIEPWLNQIEKPYPFYEDENTISTVITNTHASFNIPNGQQSQSSDSHIYMALDEFSSPTPVLNPNTSPISPKTNSDQKSRINENLMLHRRKSANLDEPTMYINPTEMDRVPLLNPSTSTVVIPPNSCKDDLNKENVLQRKKYVTFDAQSTEARVNRATETAIYINLLDVNSESKAQTLLPSASDSEEFKEKLMLQRRESSLGAESMIPEELSQEMQSLCRDSEDLSKEKQILSRDSGDFNEENLTFQRRKTTTLGAEALETEELPKQKGKSYEQHKKGLNDCETVSRLNVKNFHGARPKIYEKKNPGK